LALSKPINAKILLIDDDRDVTKVMTGGLQRYGLQVTAYSDPEHALSQYEVKHYDMILLDIRMPGMTGIQLAKKIWSVDPDAKVGFFSAFEIYEKEAKIMVKDLKSVLFIKKPILPSELAKMITAQL
jgi:DNA-binding response OmpR family regulator